MLSILLLGWSKIFLQKQCFQSIVLKLSLRMFLKSFLIFVQLQPNVSIKKKVVFLEKTEHDNENFVFRPSGSTANSKFSVNYVEIRKFPWFSLKSLFPFSTCAQQDFFKKGNFLKSRSNVDKIYSNSRYLEGELRTLKFSIILRRGLSPSPESSFTKGLRIASPILSSHLVSLILGLVGEGPIHCKVVTEKMKIPKTMTWYAFLQQ